MAYLVLCPTCGAKMSVNARTCPVCGETEFFEKRCEPQLHESRCAVCQGTGRQWKYTFHSGYDYNPAFPPKKGDAVLRFPEFGHGKPIIFRDVITSSEIKHYLMWAIDNHYYEISSLGYQNCELNFGYCKCPYCGGTGKITERIEALVETDIRRKA